MHTASSAAERAITTTFRKSIWKYFVAAVRHYQLIQPGDRIAVCVSGGKDSLLLAKCMQLLERYSDFPFETVFLAMDPGFTPEKRAQLLQSAEELALPLHLFETDIFESIEQAKNSPCHVCASMRRGHLYKQAQLLKCNKIALGHHHDDVIQTTLMSVVYGGEFKTMMPKLKSRNYPGMELIRPLYLVREEQVMSFARKVGMQAMTCACRVTQQPGGGGRQEIKRLIDHMKQLNPNVESCIFSSAQKVSLGAVLGWRLRDTGPFTSFLAQYDAPQGPAAPTE